jgi:ribosomal protein L37AE/L43A
MYRIDDYYEDWKNELISFQSNLNKYNPEIKKGTRASFGLDTSIEYYNVLQKIRLELIESGAIKDQCINCKSIDTILKNPIWQCNNCNQKWNPLKLLYKGIDDTNYE